LNKGQKTVKEGGFVLDKFIKIFTIII